MLIYKNNPNYTLSATSNENDNVLAQLNMNLYLPFNAKIEMQMFAETEYTQLQLKLIGEDIANFLTEAQKLVKADS